MTKFEQIGVNLQYDACSKYQARKNFGFSCQTCCERGMRILCDDCAIAAAHKSTIAAFETAKQNKRQGRFIYCG